MFIVATAKITNATIDIMIDFTKEAVLGDCH